MNPIDEPNMAHPPLVDDHATQLGRSTIDPHVIERAAATKSVMRRLVKTVMMTAIVAGGVVIAMYKMRVDIPALNTPKIYAYLDAMSVRRRAAERAHRRPV